MDEDALIQRVALAIYGVSPSIFSLVTGYESRRMAEAAVRVVLFELKKAEIEAGARHDQHERE